MAVVSDQFVATLSRTVFVKRPDLTRMFTAEPRAIVNFNVFNGVVSAKPSNDQQNIVIALDLPFQFAYRMIELTCHVFQDVAGDWSTSTLLDVTNAIRQLEQGTVQRHPGTSTIGTRRNVQVFWAIDMTVPRYIMQSTRPGVSPTITFEAGNDNASAGAAGTVNFYASFFEYEIEQVQMYPIHYPALVLERS